MFGNQENNFRLDKLKEGDTFKFSGEVWEIVEVGLYDWKADGNSIEYVIRSKTGDNAFLEVEYYKGDYDVYFSKSIRLQQIDMEEAFVNNSIVYNDKTYSCEECYSGAYKNNTKGSSWTNLDIKMFYSRKEILTIEDWKDGTFEAFLGYEVKAKHIKNIKR